MSGFNFSSPFNQAKPESKSVFNMPTEEAIAQARFALFEKHLKVIDSLKLAQAVFPSDSANVRFWYGEERRVHSALVEFGGRP